MNGKSWLKLASVIVAVTVAGSVAHSRQQSGVRHTIFRAASTDSALILAGVLGPNVTTPVDVLAGNISVPLNSDVVKGQVIGEALSMPAQPAGPSLSPREASTALAAAAAKVRDAEAGVAAAYDRQQDAGVQEAAARSAESVANSQLENLDLRFREGGLSEALYHQDLDSQTDCAAAVETTRTLKIASDEALVAAQDTLTRAREELALAEQRQESAYALAAERPSLVTVTAPADGVLVSRDPVIGTYGIGTDDTSLRVETQVPEADLYRLRAGQQAVVFLDRRPEVTLRATIRTISDTPTESAMGPVYPVVLSVANPDGFSFDGVPVHIRIIGDAQ